MQFRHEWKHLINYGDYIELTQRLRTVLSPDPHAEPNGTCLLYTSQSASLTIVSIMVALFMR